jgi:hypothetical protein
MTRSHRIPRLALALAVAPALLFSPAAARPAGHAHAQPAIVVPTSSLNARWPREPASGPLPASGRPAPASPAGRA